MNRAIASLAVWIGEESGQDLIEYALVIAFVALVVLASLKTLSLQFLNMLTLSLQIIFSTF